MYVSVCVLHVQWRCHGETAVHALQHHITYVHIQPSTYRDTSLCLCTYMSRTLQSHMQRKQLGTQAAAIFSAIFQAAAKQCSNKQSAVYLM